MQIILSPDLTKEHQEIILVWLQNPRALNRGEWTKALAAFDFMRLCTVLWRGYEYTFTTFYEHVVDEKYATQFIEAIYSLNKIEQEGYRLLR